MVGSLLVRRLGNPSTYHLCGGWSPLGERREGGSQAWEGGGEEGRRKEGRRQRRKERDEGAEGGRDGNIGSGPKVGFLEMNQAPGERRSVYDP